MACLVENRQACEQRRPLAALSQYCRLRFSSVEVLAQGRYVGKNTPATLNP
jgi:hypothetical protein